ncbi:unnamed protein product [Cochlearia groenlandica]
MVKTLDTTKRYFYRTEKEEEAEKEATSSWKVKEDAYKESIHVQIFDITLRHVYESMLDFEESKRDTEEPLDSLIDSSQRQLLGEQVTQLMNVQPRRETESLTGKKWGWFQELMSQDSSSSSSPSSSSSSSSSSSGLEESKIIIASIGSRLTKALIKMSLMDLHPSQREKQLSIKNWILQQSCKEKSPVMFLFDFLLYKYEELAEFEQPRKCDVLTEEELSEKDRITDSITRRFGESMCSVELVALVLSTTIIGEEEKLDGVTSEIDLCEDNVKGLERYISDMLLKTNLRLKKDYLMKQTKTTDFLERIDKDLSVYWGDCFWFYLDKTNKLARFTRHDIIYSLCLKMEFD